MGEWGTELTTAQARRKAETLRGQVRDRRDPVAERKVARAETLKDEAQAKIAAAAVSNAIEMLIADWTTHHRSARSASYAKRVPAEMRVALKTWLTSASSVPARPCRRHGRGGCPLPRAHATRRARCGGGADRLTGRQPAWRNGVQKRNVA